MNPNNPGEHAEQVAVVRFLHLHGIPHFSVPNGGTHNARTGHVLKAEGRRAGAPDLLVFLPHVTLALEMKTRTGGRLSPEQTQWGQFLGERPGWVWYVAKGAQDAIKHIIQLHRSNP